MTNNKQNYLLLLGGVLAGALVGASAVLLTAPQSGLQTRTMIRTKSVELKDRVVAGANETRDRAGKTLGEVKNRAGDVFVDMKGRAGEVLQNVRRPLVSKQEANLELEDASATE